MSDQLRLPKFQLFLVCACRFPEPMYYTIHIPFIYFMIRDFKITDENNIGYYVSLITSAFALAQFISGMPCGWLSDRIGRKPVVLIGLSCTTIGFFTFGLSTSFAWAITAKVFAGLFNGNISVLKSILSELTVEHNAADRTQAYSLLQVTFALGGITGASIGGYLSEPVKRFPNVFGNMGKITEFLLCYPYFLPCFVGTCISIVCLLLNFLFLKETLKFEPDSTLDECQPLLGSKSRVSFNNITEITPEKTWKELFYESITQRALIMMILSSVICFETLYFDELLPTWSATPRQSGGLGFESKDIGSILTIAGIITLIFQVFVLYRITAIFSLLGLLQFAIFLTTIVSFVVGFCRYLYLIPDFSGQTETKFWVWIGLIPCVGAKALGQTISLTLSGIMLNNSIEKSNKLGFVNGFSQCCNSAMRALSPAITGFIWSGIIASDWISLDIRSYISWAILGTLCTITFFASLRLNSNDYNRPHAIS